MGSEMCIRDRDIYVHDEECLALTEDESQSSSDDSVPSPGREE